MIQSPLAQRLFSSYFSAEIELLRSTPETDADGDQISGDQRVITTIPGRIVRGSDPRMMMVASREAVTGTWEIRLPMDAVEAHQGKCGCSMIQPSDQLRDKKSGATYDVIDTDLGRTEAFFVSVSCVRTT